MIKTTEKLIIFHDDFSQVYLILCYFNPICPMETVGLADSFSTSWGCVLIFKLYRVTAWNSGSTPGTILLTVGSKHLRKP